MASRDLHTARRVFGNISMRYFQSPILQQPPSNPIHQPRNFAHLLHNVGFGSIEQLEPLVSAWRSLLDTIAPDVIIAEHAPTALLASRFQAMRRVVLGTGFFSPPDVSPRR